MKPYSTQELIAAQEVMQCNLNNIHNIQVFMPYIRDKQLMKIVVTHISHLTNEYTGLFDLFNQQKFEYLKPYIAPTNFQVKYGLYLQTPQSPNSSAQEIEDNGVATILYNSMKSSASIIFKAALECINPALRHTLRQFALDSSEMSFELLQYLNQNGFYQVTTNEADREQLISNWNFVRSKEL